MNSDRNRHAAELAEVDWLGGSPWLRRVKELEWGEQGVIVVHSCTSVQGEKSQTHSIAR